MSLLADTLVIPGTDATATWERDDGGRLRVLRAGGRTYVTRSDGETRIGELLTYREAAVGRVLWRHACAAGTSWTEEYRWDDAGRLAEIDGVTVRRDERGRVVACHDAAATWTYGYAGDHLAVIESPRGVRHVVRGDDGRPVLVREPDGRRELAYDAEGRRTDAAAPPEGWHRDGHGRLWTVRAADGGIVHTFLWDGLRCLARVDGPPGDPLAAAFCLDPGGTPVRVVDGAGARRIPRDAFGEGLLDHRAVPGLFGGAIARGLVYLPERALDPTVGAFTMPDPFAGLDDDPRRDTGFRGALPVDDPACGPYAVAQHDPIGRTDPTGGFSAWLTFLDLTWGWNNNVLSVFGLDLFVNMLISPLSELWERGNTRRSFTADSIHAESHDTWGVRRDGFVSYEGKAWTYGHTIWIGETMKAENSRAACFVPAGAVRPTYYGSILRVAPAADRPFLLRGSRPATTGAGTTSWSRVGGVAEPVAPGIMTPVFPAGGLHFDARDQTRHGQDGTLAELFPGGEPIRGQLAERHVLTIGAVGLGLVPSTAVFVEDAATPVPARHLTAVLSAEEESGKTRVVLELPASSALGRDHVRLRSLTGPAPAEVMNAAAGGDLLDAVGTTQPYDAGDLLRLGQGGMVVGVAVVDRLEARLALDADIGVLAAPLTVFHAVRTGAAIAATVTGATTFEVAGGALVPNAGDMVEVSDGAAAVAAIAVTVAAPVVTLDRALAPLAGAVTWQPILALVTPLGTDATFAAATGLSYTAAAVRTAPQTGFARVVAADGAAVVRTITGRLADGLAFAAALPGNAGAPYDVERFGFGGVDRDGLSAAPERHLALPAATLIDAPALRLYQFPLDVVVSGGQIFDNGVMDSPAAVTSPSLGSSADVGTLVRVTAAGTTVDRVVTELRLLVTLEPNPAGAGLDAIRLGVDPDEPAYTGSQPAAAAALTIVVSPVINGHPSEMPRFLEGELVRVTAAGVARAYRIAVVERAPDVLGCALTLEGNVPVPSGAVTVERLGALDPENGGSRVALDGRPPAGAAPPPDQRSFRVWTRNRLLVDDILGVIVNGVTWPALVTSRISQTVVFDAPTPFAAGTAMVELHQVQAAAQHFCGDVQQHGRELLLRDLPAGSLPGTGLVVAVPFRATAASVTAGGKLSSGTTRVPVEPDRELDRYQSLLDHELRHTRQTAYLGPLLLGGTPRAPLEALLDRGDRIDPPRFSQYVEARLEIGVEYVDPVLFIDGETDVVFSIGDRVEVTSPSGQAVLVTLEEETDDESGFIIDDPDGEVEAMPQGTVFVRRQMQQAWWGRELPSDFMRFFTYGGVLRFIHAWTYGLVGTLAARGVYAAYRGLFGHRQAYPALVTDDPSVLHVLTEAGREALAKTERVLIHQGKRTITQRVFNFDGENLKLESDLIIDGEVEVRAYTRWDRDPWDWSRYNAARVPDPARPAAIRVENVEQLELRKRDHVRIKGERYEKLTRVVGTAAGGMVELKDPIPQRLLDRDLRIAHVRRENPLDGLELGFQREHMDWLKYVVDLQGTLLSKIDTRKGGFWERVIQVYRFLTGPYSWSALPNPGWFFWDNAFKQANPQRSCMEQDASEHSGSLYSPLGRITGSLAYVGDLARYIYFADGDDVTRGDRSDAPGVHFKDELRVMPFVDAEISGSPFPLNRTETRPPPGGADLANEPAHALPDELFAKDTADPAQVALTMPRASGLRPLAYVRSSGAIRRASGGLVGFSRPGKHRITVDENITNAATSRDAASAGSQKIFFDRDVKDVTVRIGGVDVLETLAPQTVELIVTQLADIDVTPAGERRYAVRVLRPTTGTVLRADGAQRLRAMDVIGTEPVQIDRVHRLTGVDTYENDLLNRVGVTLPRELRIPVRRLTVTVVNTVPLRHTADLLDGSKLLERHAGELAFVVVPSLAGVPGPVAFAYPGGAPATDPTVTFTPAAASAALIDAVGVASVFEVTITAPEEEVDVTTTIPVSAGPVASQVTLTFKVRPWFVIGVGPGPIPVTRGAMAPTRLDCGIEVGSATIDPPADMTIAPINAGDRFVDVSAAPGATPGNRVLTVVAGNATAIRTIQVV